MHKSTLYSLAAATATSLLPAVYAHGFLQSFAVDGHEYPGFVYYNQDTSGPMRVTDYLTPWYDVTAREIACGLNARKSTGIANVHPGSVIEWGWRTDNDKTWVHHEGTSRTFIGSCNGDCSTVDETNIEWWEILQKGRADDGTWPVVQLNNGQRWVDIFPSGVPDGDYLLRNELTAFHYSTESVYHPETDGHKWGMEFYPTCVAIRVSGGSGNIPSQVMKFPGAYTVDEPGHYNPDLWQSTYKFQFAATNTYTRSGGDPNPGNGNNNGSNNNNNPPTTTPAATSPQETTNTPGVDPAVPAPVGNDPISSPVDQPTCKDGHRVRRMKKRSRAAADTLALGRRGHLEAVSRRRHSSSAH